MKLTIETLRDLSTGFQAAYNEGVTQNQAASRWPLIAQEFKSTSSDETYGWLKDIPGVREWVGDRVIHKLSNDGFRLTNKDYESTIGVDTNTIEDDKYAIFGPRFRLMGAARERHPDETLWPLLKRGFTEACWDGQYFFDTDHPSLDKDGVATTRANTDGGSGTPWFLIASASLLKPLIWQVRKDGGFQQLTPDEYVLRNRWVEYGVHLRAVGGFGFWPAIWGSKQTLNATNYAIARAAMIDMKGDYDKPLGLVPDLLIVPGALDDAARRIVVADYEANGASNIFKGTARLEVVPWLA